MIHALTCPIRRRWLRWRWHMPFWRDDKVAKMLGVAHLGCPRCGRGAGLDMLADPHDHRDDATAIGDSTGWGGPVGGAS